MKYCDSNILSKIDGYIAEHRDEILNNLLELVSIPSVRRDAEPDAPFGRECAAMLNAAADIFESNGFETKVRCDLGYALSYFGGGGKNIGVFTHTDVVPVDDKWQVCKPFEPIIKDGFVFGRGCEDNKSGVIQSLYAAKIIRDLGLEFNNRLVMFNGSNEESGMEDIDAFAENETMPDVSLVPDAMYPCVSGERSIMNFWVSSVKPLKKVKKIGGGQAFNIVLGQIDAEIEYSDILLEQVMKVSKDNDRISISNDSDTIYITATGVARHIMDSETSLNAAKVLADALCLCDALGDDVEIFQSLSKFLSDCYGTGFGINHNDDVFGKLMCANGMVDITDDGRIELSFDCRFGLSCDEGSVCRTIEATCGDDWNFKLEYVTKGYNISDDNNAKIAMEDVYESLSGIKGQKGIKIAAGTYARRLKNALPIGNVAPYKVKKLEMPVGHGGVHQPDEMLSIDGFLEGLKILICAILEIDKVI